MQTCFRATTSLAPTTCSAHTTIRACRRLLKLSRTPLPATSRRCLTLVFLAADESSFAACSCWPPSVPCSSSESSSDWQYEQFSLPRDAATFQLSATELFWSPPPGCWTLYCRSISRRLRHVAWETPEDLPIQSFLPLTAVTSGADSIGHGGMCPSHFYKWLGTGGAPWVEEQQTRNWPNCIDHHERAHQNDQLYF